MGKQHPLSKEELGDEMLNEARDLVTSEVQFMIGEDDLRVIEERIDYARDMRSRLNNKSCIQKVIHTRKYVKYAKGVFQEAKFISERAYDRLKFQHPPGTSPKTGSEDIYRIARSLYRCWLSKEPFPSPPTQDKWVVDAWNVACHRTDSHPDSLRRDEEIKCDSMELLTDMKTKIKHAVDYAYEFETSRSSDSISRNATRAQALLAKTNFIYLDLNIGGRPRYPFRHPIIQEAVNLTLFANKDDIGIDFSDDFNPIPFEVIALAVTVIECRIDEWYTGTCNESTWKEERYRANYQSHLNSLIELKNHGPREEGRNLVQQIQDDLLRNARKHAGDHDSDPPTRPSGSGRLSMYALDAAILDGSPVRRGQNRTHHSLINCNRVSPS